MEEWKDIEGYEGLYQVSSEGRVKRFYKNGNEKILKNRYDKDGYDRIVLYYKNKPKYFFVHRLVAQAFIPNTNNLPQVNHKDEDKTNNSVSNLEWCTNEYNIRYSCCKKVLCIETNVIYNSIIEASRQTGINQSHICKVCNGKYKTAGKYHWQYI